MRRTRRSAGVSLIEALVALAVMGFGMLAVVGLQSTLRQNADTAKQRAEAVRIAQEEIEHWRAFAALQGDAGTLTYGNLNTEVLAGVAGSNATFTLTRTVEESTAPAYKTLLVDVSWSDRRGDPQSVRLSTAIAAIQPSLAGTLVTPPAGNPTRRPHGRNPQIPWQAKDLGDGTSGLKPPGAPDTVAWRFDNVTGLITLCSVDAAVAATTRDLTLGNLTCSTDNALLLSGYVRYALTATQPMETDARNPGSDPIDSLTVSVTRSDGGAAPTCYRAAVFTPTQFTIYSCAIPVTVSDASPRPSWSGSVSLGSSPESLMATSLAEDDAGKFKACSYPNPGVLAGVTTFTGGGNSIDLTPPSGNFRAWAAGSRIDLVYDRQTYVYTVSASVGVPESPATSQSIAVVEVLPGPAESLSAIGYVDIWPYANVSVPLSNQNYLMIRAGDDAAPFSCPMSTVRHQPAT